MGLVLSRLDEIDKMSESEYEKYSCYMSLHDGNESDADAEADSIAEPEVQGGQDTATNQETDSRTKSAKPTKVNKKAKQHARRAARVMM